MSARIIRLAAAPRMTTHGQLGAATGIAIALACCAPVWLILWWAL